MNDALALAEAKIQSFVDGFFWILPNLAIGTIALLVFVLAARLAGRAVRRVAQRRDRSDLGVLLGAFANGGGPTEDWPDEAGKSEPRRLT